jgi:hypothetical protein
MKKTDFPDKCSGCRLLNREKMRAALEDGAPKKPSGKPVPEQYKLSVVEAKGNKTVKPKAPKKKAAEAVAKADTEVPSGGTVEKEYPKLPLPE